MTLAELKAKAAAILDKAKTENRSLTAAENTEIETIKADILKEEKVIQAATEQQRSAAAAAAARLNRDDVWNMKSNEFFRKMATLGDSYMRSISTAGQDVGNKEVIADVVRQFNLTSPIYAAHQNVQPRSTGVVYSYTRINKGGSGFVKTEGAAAPEDTVSSVTMVSQTFKTYSSEKLQISQEMLDDAVADISQEVMTLGLAKSVLAFGADCVTALESAFLVSNVFTPTDTAGTSWAFSDIVAAYYEIPVRNRYGVKYICNGATAQALVSLLTNINAPQAAIIGFTADNIVEDSAMPNNVLIIGNITISLAIGRKEPVRVFMVETSEGRTVEVQPRLAVGLRDSTALAARHLKSS